LHWVLSAIATPIRSVIDSKCSLSFAPRIFKRSKGILSFAMFLFGLVKLASAQDIAIQSVYVDDAYAGSNQRVGRGVLSPSGWSQTQLHVILVRTGSTGQPPESATVSIKAVDNTGSSNAIPTVNLSGSVSLNVGVTDLMITIPELVPTAMSTSSVVQGYSFPSRIIDIQAVVSPAISGWSTGYTRINLDRPGVPDWVWEMREAGYTWTSGPNNNGLMWNNPGQANSDIQFLASYLYFNTILVGSYYTLNGYGSAIGADPWAFSNFGNKTGGYSFPALSYNDPPQTPLDAILNLVQDIRDKPAFQKVKDNLRVMGYCDPGVLSNQAVGNTGSVYTFGMAAKDSNNQPIPFRAFETINWAQLIDDAIKYGTTKGATDNFNSINENESAYLYSPYDAYQKHAGLGAPVFLSQLAGYYPNFSSVPYRTATLNDLVSTEAKYVFDGLEADDMGRGLQVFAAQPYIGSLLIYYVDSSLWPGLVNSLGLGIALAIYTWTLNLIVPVIDPVDWTSIQLSKPSLTSPLYPSSPQIDWTGMSSLCENVRVGINGPAWWPPHALISSDYFDMWNLSNPFGGVNLPAQALATDCSNSDQYLLFSRPFALLAHDTRAYTRKPFRTDSNFTEQILNNCLGYNHARSRAICMGLAWAQGANIYLPADKNALVGTTSATDQSVVNAVRQCNALRAQEPELFDSPYGASNMSPKDLCFHSAVEIGQEYNQPFQILNPLNITSTAGSLHSPQIGSNTNGLIVTAYRQTITSSPNEQVYTVFVVNTGNHGSPIGNPLNFQLNIPLPLGQQISAQGFKVYSPSVDGYGPSSIVNSGTATSPSIKFSCDTFSIIQFSAGFATPNNAQVGWDTLAGIQVSPTSIQGGNGSVKVTVTLNAPPVDNSLVVNLSCSLAGTSISPQSLVFSVGQTSASANLSPPSVNTNTSATVTATLLGQSLAGSFLVTPTAMPWSKYHHDPQNTGQTSIGSGSKGKNSLSYEAENSVSCTPVLSPDGTVVYVGSYDGNLYALYTSTMTLAAQPFAMNYSSTCSPLVDAKNNVYAVGNGVVYSLKLPTTSSGNFTVNWKASVGASSSPSISNDGSILYVSTGTGLDAIYTNSGSQVWTTQCAIPSGSVSCPAVGSNYIYVVGLSDNNANLYGVSLTGSIVLQTSTNLYHGIDEEFWGSPCIGPDGTVYAVVLIDSLQSGNEPNGSIWALNGTNFDPIWHYELPNLAYNDPTVFIDGTVYVDSGGQMFAMKYSNSTLSVKSIQIPTSGGISSTSSIAADQTVYVGDSNGVLYAIAGLTSTSPGSIYWTFGANRRISGAPAIDLFGTLFFGDSTGYIYSLK